MPAATPRPKGRPPKGKVWDTITGAWTDGEAGRRLPQKTPPKRPKGLRMTPEARVFLSATQEGVKNRRDPRCARDAKGRDNRKLDARDAREEQRKASAQSAKRKMGLGVPRPARHSADVPTGLQEYAYRHVARMETDSDNNGTVDACARTIVRVAAAAASGTTNPARTLAAAADALLQTEMVAKASTVARATTSKKKSAKKSKKSKQKRQMKLAGKVERGAYIDTYSRYASQQEVEDVRMAVQYETTAEAAASGRDADSILRHPLFKQENQAELAAVGFKLDLVLDGIDVEWPSKHHTCFNGFSGRARAGKGLAGPGGWGKLGLCGSDDTIITGGIRVNAAVRGALLKSVLELGSRAPPEFFSGARRVRRVPVLDTVWGNQDDNARAQRDYVEEQAAKGRNTLNFGGGAAKSVYSGGNYMENPVARFKDSKVLVREWTQRVGVALRSYHERDMLNCITVNAARLLSPEERCAMLRAAHVEQPEELDDEEQVQLILTAYNTFDQLFYGDGADVTKTCPTVMQSMQLAYYPWQWKVPTAEAHAALVRDLLWTVRVDSWGKCGGGQEEIRSHVRLLAEQLHAAGGATVSLGGGYAPVTQDEVVARKWLGEDEPEPLPANAAAPRVALRLRYLKGDIAHNQRALGVQASGKYNDPIQVLPDTERAEAACLILAEWRTLETVVAGFSGGPSGDADGVWDTKLKAGWKSAEQHYFQLPTMPTNVERSKGALREVLRGSALLSGVVCGDVTKAGCSELSGGLLAPLPDAMHCVGGYAKMVIQQLLKTFGGDTAVRAKTELQRRGVMRYEQQRNRDWVLCAIEIVRVAGVGIACNDGGASIPVPPESAALLRALVELRALLYTDPRASRDRAHILSTACATLNFAFASEACFSYAWGEKATKEHGLYRTSLVQMGILTRLVAMSQANCEQHEAVFGFLKKMMAMRSTNKIDEQVRLLRHAVIARELKQNTNMTASRLGSSDESSMQAAFTSAGLGPVMSADGKTASYHYTQEQVASPLFVLFILVFYADYLTGGIAWFKDDAGSYNRGCRGCTIFCKAGTDGGALLLDGFWHSGNTLKERISVEAAKVLDPQYTFEFPGWKSVADAFQSLIRLIDRDERPEAAALRKYLLSVGCAERASSSRGESSAHTAALERVEKGSDAVAKAYQRVERQF
jgi:hypothetical protein